MATTPPRLPLLLRHHARRAHAAYCRRHTSQVRARTARWWTQGWLMLAGAACAATFAVAATRRHWPELIAVGLAAYAISRTWHDGTTELLADEKNRVAAQVAHCKSCAEVQAAESRMRACKRCDSIAELRLAAATPPPAPPIDHEE